MDDEAHAEFVRTNSSGVPTFVIGDNVVVGLDKGKILELVDHRLINCVKCAAKMRVPLRKGTLKVTCPKCKHVFTTTPR